MNVPDREHRLIGRGLLEFHLRDPTVSRLSLHDDLNVGRIDRHRALTKRANVGNPGSQRRRTFRADRDLDIDKPAEKFLSRHRCRKHTAPGLLRFS